MARETSARVVVNGRFLARRVTGVERYGREILSCMDGSYTIEKTRAQGWLGHSWEQFFLPAKIGSQSMLWSPANTGPLVIRNQALTIHDLSPLEHPEWFKAGFCTWYRLFLPLLARHVQKIFTPSEYVRQKVTKRFGIENVIVTPNGVDPAVFHAGARQDSLVLPQSYVLFVGSLELRKNLHRLLGAWKQVKDDFRQTSLLIVGVRGQVFKQMNFSQPLERVRFLGYVEDCVLAGLYANATVTVLPSQEEGFGLPALEAMACGAPVIVSDGGALPDVVGEAGMIFPLANPVGLAHALKRVLSESELRADLREKGLARARQFSWQTTADLVWKNLNE